MSKRGQLVIYSGPSGVGKGTLLGPLLATEPGLVLSVSATTRAPRKGEVDGVHYHFICREEFERLIAGGEMLEYTEYNGNYYGTPKKFVEQRLDAGYHVVLEIEVDGAMQVHRLCPDALMIFVCSSVTGSPAAKAVPVPPMTAAATTRAAAIPLKVFLLNLFQNFILFSSS